MKQLNNSVNLIVCQKSMIDTWRDHLNTYYDYLIYDLTNKKELDKFIQSTEVRVGIINYDLIFRRKELLKIKDFCLVLDESSLINNEKAKRSKFIMKLQAKEIILLSGSLCGGKYERLWSQLHLLGWNISKQLYWKQYIETETTYNQGFPIKIVKGYKNVDRLKHKMCDYGCRFLKTDEVFDLPKQIFNTIKIDSTREYKIFRKDRIVSVGDTDFVGDTTLTKLLYERMLCGAYNKHKIEALKDLLESTSDRVIIFYNFNNELESISKLCTKPVSIVNGKEKDLSSYEKYDDSVTLIQYQAGAMGLNLQKANKIIYFTPPLSSELFEQSKKRVHRIGQEKPCFYYLLTVKNSVEGRIYKTLAMRKDFTDYLFEKGD